jgi:hypothetical protein
VVDAAVRRKSTAWRQSVDSGGSVDIATWRFTDGLPENIVLSAFTPAHLVAELDRIEVGIRADRRFPLGFMTTCITCGGAPSGDCSAFGIVSKAKAIF